MQFLNTLAAYQTTGDRTVINSILAYMRDRAESRAVKPGDDASVYVAIRANTVTYPERLTLEYEPTAISEYRESVHNALGVDIFGGPDLVDFRVNAAAILQFLGRNEYEALIYAVERWLDYGIHERAVIIPALEHALSRVDAWRSEREVVRYINRAFETEYRRLLIAHNGTIRLGRRDKNGQYRNVYVMPNRPEPWRIILERRIDPEEVQQLLRKLTAKQREYIERAYVIVSADVEAGSLSEYKVSESGEYRIKVRYMAEKLGVEESNLRKCLSKVRGRTSYIVPTIAY